MELFEIIETLLKNDTDIETFILLPIIKILFDIKVYIEKEKVIIETILKDIEEIKDRIDKIDEEN